MRWQLLESHYIDEQVLPAGTIVGDETQWPYRSNHNDKKIGRKIGDPLPPSRAMTPMDQEAHKVYRDTFGDEIPNPDPTASIPLTGAPNAPRVSGPGAKPEPYKPASVNPAPDAEPKTGINAPPPKPTMPAPDIKKI